MEKFQLQQTPMLKNQLHRLIINSTKLDDIVYRALARKTREVQKWYGGNCPNHRGECCMLRSARD